MRFLTLTLLALVSLAATAQAGPVSSGCYAIRANSTGKYISHNGRHSRIYNANRSMARAWEKFKITEKHGRYTIMGDDGITMRFGLIGIVKKDGNAEWTIVKVGDKYAFSQVQSVAGKGSVTVWLSADKTLDGLLAPRFERHGWELFTLVPTTGCP